MNEHDLLLRLAAHMPRPAGQLGGIFQSDAEILRWGDQYLLFSTDEFSGEDLFLTTNPYDLGHNMACAAISDILATGGTPVYYAHSLTVDASFDLPYTEAVYKGIADVLREAGASFIGGDFGQAEQWRCCASVIGRTEKPVLRSGAKPGDWIYITGQVGAGNVQAVMSLYGGQLEGVNPPNFTLRTGALGDICAYATSCIDTSDGLFSAMRTIARMSGTGFSLENIPYLPVGRAVAQLAHLPLEMLILCECGEYELLFTSPNPDLPYGCIGRITGEGMLLDGRDVSRIDLSARAWADRGAYIEEVKRVCGGL